jgi:hypothetical protein
LRARPRSVLVTIVLVCTIFWVALFSKEGESYTSLLYWSVQFSGLPCSLKKVGPISHCCTDLYIFIPPLPEGNQLTRQTGSRNLMGPKPLHTIWVTYMKLVTKYQIFVINSCWEKCDEKCAYMFNAYKSVFWPIRFLLPVCRRAGVS